MNISLLDSTSSAVHVYHIILCVAVIFVRLRQIMLNSDVTSQSSSRHQDHTYVMYIEQLVSYQVRSAPTVSVYQTAISVTLEKMICSFWSNEILEPCFGDKCERMSVCMKERKCCDCFSSVCFFLLFYPKYQKVIRNNQFRLNGLLFFFLQITEKATLT